MLRQGLLSDRDATKPERLKSPSEALMGLI